MVDRADRTSDTLSLPSPDGTEDWPAQAADTVVRVVDSIRSKTTGPATTVARAIVYGLFATLLGIAALILLAITLVRVLDAYLPNAVFGEEHVWAAHLIVGAVFSFGGLLLWSRRKARATG